MYAMQHEPERLASLGYVTRWLQSVEVILPPVRVVAAGEFLLGSSGFDDPDATADERPRHRLHLADFAMMRFPVTVAEYECFTRIGGDQPAEQESQWREPSSPETHVTWAEACDYARWLAALTGQPWRLPTEAEWEKAARWDATNAHARIYPWGDQFEATRCATRESGATGPAPVGLAPSGASPYGIEEMAGNVWEWTSTIPRAYPYVADDGREEPSIYVRHVLRGGSWQTGAASARAACRASAVPGAELADVGFRLVYSLTSAPHPTPR